MVHFNDVVYYGESQYGKNFIEEFCSLPCTRGKTISHSKSGSFILFRWGWRKVALFAMQFFAALTVFVPLIMLSARTYLRWKYPITDASLPISSSSLDRTASYSTSAPASKGVCPTLRKKTLEGLFYRVWTWASEQEIKGRQEAMQRLERVFSGLAGDCSSETELFPTGVKPPYWPDVLQMLQKIQAAFEAEEKEKTIPKETLDEALRTIFKLAQEGDYASGTCIDGWYRRILAVYQSFGEPTGFIQRVEYYTRLPIEDALTEMMYTLNKHAKKGAYTHGNILSVVRNLLGNHPEHPLWNLDDPLIKKDLEFAQADTYYRYWHSWLQDQRYIAPSNTGNDETWLLWVIFLNSCTEEYLVNSVKEKVNSHVDQQFRTKLVEIIAQNNPDGDLDDWTIDVDGLGHLTDAAIKLLIKDQLTRIEIARKEYASAIEYLKKDPENFWKLFNLLNINGKSWLYGFHIDLYMQHLSERYPSFVPPAPGIKLEPTNLGECIQKDWDMKEYREKNLAYRLKINDNHWTLVYIDREQATIEYYDSKGNFGNKTGEVTKVLTAIQSALNLKEKEKGKTYKLVHKVTQELQPDSFQCGVWTLYFLEHRHKSPNVDVNTLKGTSMEKTITSYRSTIGYEILRRTAVAQVPPNSLED